MRVSKKALAVIDVLLPNPLGHEQLDALSQELGAGIAKTLLSPGIGENDHSLLVHDDRRIRRRLEQAPELLLGAAQLGNVPHGLVTRALDRDQIRRARAELLRRERLEHVILRSLAQQPDP